MIEKTCLQCGEPFAFYPSDQDRKYCSSSCYVAWMNSHNGWKWGKARFRSDSFRTRLSQTRKRLFEEGKLQSPTLGLKRPDLAERNRRRRKYSPQEIRRLFDEYKNNRGGLRAFAKAHGKQNSGYIRELFKRTIPPDEFESVMEEKKGLSWRYAVGRRFEWRIRDHFKEAGYFVLRSPRSAGPVDLIAIRKGQILFIQCKLGGVLSKSERKALADLAESVGAIPILAWRGMGPRYPIQLEDPLGRRKAEAIVSEISKQLAHLTISAQLRGRI